MIRPRRWLNLRGTLHSSFWWTLKNFLSLSKIILRTKRGRTREMRKRRRTLSRRKRGQLLKNLRCYLPYQKQRSTNTLLNQSTNSYKKCSRKKLLLSLIKHSAKMILSGQASKSVSTHSMIRFTSNWSLTRFYLKILMKTCLKSLTILYLGFTNRFSRITKYFPNRVRKYMAKLKACSGFNLRILVFNLIPSTSSCGK